MLDSKNFRADVLPELLGRWDAREPMTSQVENDWYYVLRDFTARQAVEAIGRFFRAHAKARFPRPGEFAEWKKNSGASEWKSAAQKDDKPYFDFDIPLWPTGAAMVRCVGMHRKNQIVVFGWVERRDNGDHLFMWHRDGDGGRWAAKCLGRKSTRPEVTRIGDAPESWYRGRLMQSDPEGLSSLLSREC